ncbi:MAG: hypothetical protein R3B84_14695 [Zavarzinella sp.]
MLKCRHCSHAKVNRPRGLCWSCYYTPGVKELYPSTSKYAHRGVGNFCGTPAIPEMATAAQPGSEAKIAILMERAKAGLTLWHPDDACDYHGATVEITSDLALAC